MTFAEFERRVAAVPDMEMNWIYWNVWMPETGKLWVFMLLHALNRLNSEGDHVDPLRGPDES